MRRNFFFRLLVGLVLLSCGSSEEPPLPSLQGKDYYPLDSITRVYKIDSIIFDLEGTNRQISTSSGFLRQRMILVDRQWVVEESYRSTDTMPWSVCAVIPIVQRESSIWEEVDGAILKKIIWPLDQTTQWEETEGVSASYRIRVAGEEIRPFSIPWVVSISAFDMSGQINNLNFDAVMRKCMVKEDVVIEYREAEEWYAKDVGLIYRYMSFLDTQCEHKGGDISNCVMDSWADKANRGLIVRQEIIEYQ